MQNRARIHDGVHVSFLQAAAAIDDLDFFLKSTPNTRSTLFRELSWNFSQNFSSRDFGSEIEETNILRRGYMPSTRKKNYSNFLPSTHILSGTTLGHIPSLMLRNKGDAFNILISFLAQGPKPKLPYVSVVVRNFLHSHARFFAFYLVRYLVRDRVAIPSPDRTI